MLEDNKNKIEDIKRHLYDPGDKTMSHPREGVLHQVHHKVTEEWGDDQINHESNMKPVYKKPAFSFFKKFFIVSFIFFLAALGYAYFKFSQNNVSVSADKIDISVVGNAFTKGGDDLPLQIEIKNNNTASLELTNLSVEYPKGAEDSATDVVRLPRDIIGTIKPGENVIRNINVKLYGSEKSIRNIKVSLEYHPEGSNAIFSKDKYYPVTISLAPLSLNIDAPSTTVSDQSISFKITATLNTTLPSDNPVLQVNYPNNFIFDSAIPAPSLGNSIWDLSALTVDKPITIEVKGRLTGQDGDEQVFHVYAGTTSGTDQSNVSVIYSSILQKVLITKPYLDARILVNSQDQSEYVVSGGVKVNTEILWENNLPTRITGGQIIVSLSGNAFDKNTVVSNNGFYDSANNQIIWDMSSVPALSEINPGEKGNVSFSFIPLSLVGQTDLKDPQVLIKVSIKGRQPTLGTTFNDINNFTEKIVKLQSDFQIVSSPVYESGSMPPKAESQTRYTINWTLSNSANIIAGAEARSVLPVYIKWVGLPPGDKQNVSYNEVTREVIWNIGTVAPYTGINSNQEVSFIISISPSISQIDSVPQLMKEIYLSGTDIYTNTPVKVISSYITTSTGLGSGKVTQ